MGAREIVTLFICGCALLAVGLVPGTFQAIIEGMENFRASLSGQRPQTHRTGPAQRLQGQIWFAAAGALFLAISLAALIGR
jgi:hypothetical protein